MSSRLAARFTALACLALAAVASATGAMAAQPNLVLIMMDDLDAPSIEHMPETMRLIADQGVTFDRAYASATLCLPSRATFFTGRYPHSIGMQNGGHKHFYQKKLDRESLGPWLQRAGYRTAFLGKYVNDYPRGAPSPTYVPPGWSRWVGATYEQFYAQYDYGMNEDGQLVAYAHEPSDYFTTVLSRKSVEFIDDAALRAPFVPFAMIVAPSAPHVPHVLAPGDGKLFRDDTVPRTPGFAEADTRDKPPFGRFKMTDKKMAGIDAAYRRRLRMVASADRLVATIVDALRKRGLLEHTYIMVTSDHGYHMGQHNLRPDKMTAYEEDIRIPLLVRGPDVPKGAHRAHMVLNNDFAPTLVALAGGKVPSTVEGRSFAAALGPTPPDAASWRRSFLISRLPNSGLYPPPVNYPGPTKQYDCVSATPSSILPAYWAVRTPRYTYVEYGNGDRELYDNETDPNQLVNFYCSAAAPLRESLATLLTSLRTCKGATCAAAENTDIALP